MKTPFSSPLRGVLAAVALAFVAGAAYAWEAGTDGLPPIPPLSQRVTDATGTLSAADAQALSAKLAAWEQATGNQLAVLIVPSTQPEPIEAYGIRVADAWKIGRKGKDNGAVLIVAKDDKKLRIEVGYGLEGVLTDVTAKRIIADTIAPEFRQGRFAQGIDAGVDRIIAVVNQGEPPAARPAAEPSARDFPLEMILVVLLVVVPVLGAILRRIFGRALGSAVGAGIVGAGAWVVSGVLAVAIFAALVALIVLLFTGGGTGFAPRGGGVWTPSGGGWGGGGGGGGGGGFSGGGGSFGGGGASGGWD